MRGATPVYLSLVSVGFNFNPRTPCGVRPSVFSSGFHIPHFNPRTPCGVRHLQDDDVRDGQEISIHAPHAGCDAGKTMREIIVSLFQSTHPMRGATWRRHSRPHRQRHFNPRTPCGVRLAFSTRLARIREFQSTHPMRGATLGSQ